MKHTDIRTIFDNKASYIDKTVVVCGWVRTSRDSKTVAFVELNDGSHLKHIQVVIDKSKIDNVARFLPLCTALMVSAVCVKAQNNSDNVELVAQSIEVLGECPLEYPIQKKPHSLEFLRTMPHLRVRTNTFMAVNRVRSELCYAIHKYFYDRGYAYIHTPIITGSDCEGAGESFNVTTHTYKDKYTTQKEYDDKDFFGTSATLTVSGQLEAEALAMAMGKVYTFGPTFRAENSNTARHAAEFWMIEPEVAFADLDDIMEIAEDMVKYLISYVLDKCPSELELFDKFYEKGLIDKLHAIVSNKFARVEYTKAVELINSSGKQFDKSIEWGDDLATEHERYIAEEVYKCPVFVCNYPASIKSFYMKLNSDNKTVAATDLLVPSIGEIIGCSEREVDYQKLSDVVQARGMRMSDYTSYMELRKFGSAVHSGFGLGLERMIMYITGISNIRDTQLYPRAAKELR